MEASNSINQADAACNDFAPCTKYRSRMSREPWITYLALNLILPSAFVLIGRTNRVVSAFAPSRSSSFRDYFERPSA